MGCTSCCCFCMPPFFLPPTSGSTPGPAGADGLSAYEIAVNNGFVGTEEEWLESLNGEKGDPGTSGISKGLQMQLTGSPGDSITPGSNIIFDTPLVDTTTGITYNQNIGEWTITEPGLYEIKYFVNIQSSTEQYLWQLTIGDVSTYPSTIQSNQLSGQALIQVADVPQIIKLEFNSTTNIALLDRPVQADIIIMQYN